MHKAGFLHCLSNNQISDISPLKELIKFDKLKALYISDNPFVKANDLILTTNQEHLKIIQSFLARQDETEMETFVLPAKVLILGNTNSGKPSLLHYLKKGKLGYKRGSTHLINIEKYYFKKVSKEKLLYGIRAMIR